VIPRALLRNLREHSKTMNQYGCLILCMNGTLEIMLIVRVNELHQCACQAMGEQSIHNVIKRRGTHRLWRSGSGGAVDDVPVGLDDRLPDAITAKNQPHVLLRPPRSPCMPRL
jgi:hypothetical protein